MSRTRRRSIAVPASAHRDLLEAYEALRRGSPAEAERLYRRAGRVKLDDPRQLQRLAHLALEVGDDPRRARRALSRALAREPDDPQSHLLAGIAERRAGDAAAAVESFRRALALAPGWVDALHDLALALEDLGRLDEALETLDEALAAAPDDPGLLDQRGNVLTAGGRMEEAIGAYRRALELDPGAPGIRFNLAQALLASGEHRRGWELFEARLAGAAPPVEAPRWQGEDAAGRTIVAWHEQGLGDSLMFARYLPELARRGARVVVACPPPLTRLLAAVEGVSETVPPGGMPAADFEVPLPSLARHFSPDGVLTPRHPYLAPPASGLDPPGAAESAHGHPRPLRVGLAWAGNPRHPDDARRSLPPALLAPLLALDGVVPVSLAHGRAARSLTHPRLVRPRAAQGDFAELAALVAGLDLVITVDTAVAHLAGGLGIPVWTLLAYSPDWRWGRTGERTAWYPSMRLWRQQGPGDWERVIERVAAELAARVAGRAGEGVG